uniref:Uncharacterized protein n=1 Tax=Octopus bimaculoides TaxID=37653 RepID=A0A0L8FMP4_OCTBM
MLCNRTSVLKNNLLRPKPQLKLLEKPKLA